MAPVVALHHELVRARDEGEAVGVVELLGDVRAEGVPGLLFLFLWIGWLVLVFLLSVLHKVS